MSISSRRACHVIGLAHAVQMYEGMRSLHSQQQADERTLSMARSRLVMTKRWHMPCRWTKSVHADPLAAGRWPCQIQTSLVVCQLIGSYCADGSEQYARSSCGAGCRYASSSRWTSVCPVWRHFRGPSAACLALLPWLPSWPSGALISRAAPGMSACCHKFQECFARRCSGGAVHATYSDCDAGGAGMGLARR